MAIALLTCAAVSAGCGGGASGPDEESGLLRVAAEDMDRAQQGASLAGFDVADVTSYRIRVLAGSREVVDSTFVKSGPIEHEFELAANTYAVEVQGFQDGEVLLMQGVGEATVAAGDTVPLAVDLDPAIGEVDLTIAGQTTAVVPTNGSASVRVVVQNQRGQPVAGAKVDISVVPASAGTITFPGEAGTGSDGSLTGIFTAQGGEGTGQLQLAIDGFRVDFAVPRTFSIVSPVDPNRSTLTLSNTFRVPADGAAEAQVRAQILDEDGNPLANVPVVIGSSRNGPGQQIDIIRSDQTRTDAAGVFTATVSSFSSSNLAGDATITATADGKILAARGTVNFLSIVSATSTEVRVVPQLVRADGVSAAAVTVEVHGVAGGTLPNVLVSLQTRDNSLFRIQPVQGRTDANGIFRSRISSTIEIGTIIDVFADGLKTSAVGFVLFN